MKIKLLIVNIVNSICNVKQETFITPYIVLFLDQYGQESICYSSDS